ncbi:hypothetical protein K503DRAFT_529801 [Rhizopogon vinicolor AM-OR11-026]|uniref:Uncharacterized protein n=1 Tax=Rhizopogon vinicolor AM-OR11-026 TaxID=1314800 RepID=A0A1B7ML56_9AGAM|nr:hypothetical protein K503DRAFT_529801 [Rhizopogon vinicolor AM-OR11-026]
MLMNVADLPVLCYFSFAGILSADLETGNKRVLHIGLTPNGEGWNCLASWKLRHLAKNASHQTGRGDDEEGEYGGVTTDQHLVGDTASARVFSQPHYVLARLASTHRAARIHVRRRDEVHVIWRLSPHVLLHPGSKHNLTLSLPPNKGRILLVDSGIGYPFLCTSCFSDKFVPAAAPTLIYSRVDVGIVCKVSAMPKARNGKWRT